MNELQDGNGGWAARLGNVAAVLRSPYVFLSVFTATALLIVVSYAMHGPFADLPVDSQLGILGVLPAEYYLAIALGITLLVANLGNRRRGYFYASLMLAVFTFTCLESVFLYNPVGSVDAFGHFSRGASYLDSSNPLFSPSAGGYPYGYFGSFLMAKMFSETVGMANTDMVPFLSVFRAASAIVFFSMLYFLLKSVVQVASARLLTATMVFANPYFQFHYSPHAFALIALPILLYTVVVPRQNDKRIYLVQFMIFAYLMVTHGPTTVYLALAYLFAVIFALYLKRAKAMDCRINANLPMAMAIMAGTLLTNPSLINLMKITASGFSVSSVQPSITNAIGFHAWQTAGFGANILGMERLGSSYFFPETVRLLVLCACLAASLWAVWRIVKDRKLDALNLYLIGAFTATGILTAGNAIYPSLNLGDRSFLYLVFGGVLLLRNFIPEGFSFSGLADYRRLKSIFKAWPNVLVAFLILAPIANGIAYHYNNGINFQAPQYRDGYLHVVWHADHVTVFSHRDNHGMVFYRETFWQRPYAHDTFISLKRFDLAYQSPQQTDIALIIAEPTRWSYQIAEMEPVLDGLAANADSSMNLVYATTGYAVWYDPL